MAGIDAPIDGSAKHDAAALLQADEGLAPGRMVGRETGAGDRHQPSTVGKAGKRRGDMAQGGIGNGAIDMRCGRERWVHQHDARSHGIVEMVVDVRRVVASRRSTGKELPKQSRAGFRQLIQGQPAAREFSKDGEQARTGRGLEHDIGRGDRSRGGGGECELDRRRELLQRLALLGAPRMGGQKRRDLAEQ